MPLANEHSCPLTLLPKPWHPPKRFGMLIPGLTSFEMVVAHRLLGDVEQVLEQQSAPTEH